MIALYKDLARLLESLVLMECLSRNSRGSMGKTWQRFLAPKRILTWLSRSSTRSRISQKVRTRRPAQQEALLVDRLTSHAAPATAPTWARKWAPRSPLTELRPTTCHKTKQLEALSLKRWSVLVTLTPIWKLSKLWSIWTSWKLIYRMKRKKSSKRRMMPSSENQRTPTSTNLFTAEKELLQLNPLSRSQQANLTISSCLRTTH